MTSFSDKKTLALGAAGLAVALTAASKLGGSEVPEPLHSSPNDSLELDLSDISLVAEPITPDSHRRIVMAASEPSQPQELANPLIFAPLLVSEDEIAVEDPFFAKIREDQSAIDIWVDLCIEKQEETGIPKLLWEQGLHRLEVTDEVYTEATTVLTGAGRQFRIIKDVDGNSYPGFLVNRQEAPHLEFYALPDTLEGATYLYAQLQMWNAHDTDLMSVFPDDRPGFSGAEEQFDIAWDFLAKYKEHLLTFDLGIRAEFEKTYGEAQSSGADN